MGQSLIIMKIAGETKIIISNRDPTRRDPGQMKFKAIDLGCNRIIIVVKKSIRSKPKWKSGQRETIHGKKLQTEMAKGKAGMIILTDWR